MKTTPMALTKTEVGELAGIKEVRDMWGAESVEDMKDLFENHVYAVKFDFHSGGPGYVGDYFLLAGDMLGEPPVQLIRKDGKLALL